MFAWNENNVILNDFKQTSFPVGAVGFEQQISLYSICIEAFQTNYTEIFSWLGIISEICTFLFIEFLSYYFFVSIKSERTLEMHDTN